jgi:hypothetical protein
MKTKFYKEIEDDISECFSLNFLIANGQLKKERKVFVNKLSDKDREKWQSHKQFSTLLEKFKKDE